MQRLLTFSMLLLTGAAVAQSHPPTVPVQSSAATEAQAQPEQTPRKVTAKTKEEFDAYSTADAAIKSGADPAKGEAAATDFAAKFPQSELISILDQELMAKFQRADNAPKALEWARKVLAVDPDSVYALVTVATTVAETTNETDLDFEQRYDEVLKDGNLAIQLIDSGAFKPAISPEQLKAVEAAAYAAIGSIEFTRAGDTRLPASEQARHDGAAEQALRKATELNTISPEPSIWLRYAVTLDHEKKYDQALAAANRAAQLSAGNPQVAELAEQELTRLKELAPPALQNSVRPNPPPQTPPQ